MTSFAFAGQAQTVLRCGLEPFSSMISLPERLAIRHRSPIGAGNVVARKLGRRAARTCCSSNRAPTRFQSVLPRHRRYALSTQLFFLFQRVQLSMV